MERILEIKITVKVETNKATHEREFSSMREAREWLASILDGR